jgi:hypothetical protein
MPRIRRKIYAPRLQKYTNTYTISLIFEDICDAVYQTELWPRGEYCVTLEISPMVDRAYEVIDDTTNPNYAPTTPVAVHKVCMHARHTAWRHKSRGGGRSCACCIACSQSKFSWHCMVCIVLGWLPTDPGQLATIRITIVAASQNSRPSFWIKVPDCIGSIIACIVRVVGILVTWLYLWSSWRYSVLSWPIGKWKKSKTAWCLHFLRP